MAYFERFYFDTETQSCQKFVYGGCQGNANNFETIEECQKNCTFSATVAPVLGEH